MARFCLLLLLLSGLAFAQPQLPDAPGKKTVERVCFKCHGPENVLKKRHTKAQWDKVLDTMAENGAKATDAEFEEVLNYLSHYFAQINVNKASATEIQDVVDLSPEEAAAIVKYREAKGEFKTIEEVGQVPGLDAKKIAERKDRILLK
jgi:competence ComEA-like helix-hairpin-helix protein